MPDSAAKKAWIKENSIMVSIKLMKRTESDIIEYFEAQKALGNDRSTLIKKAIREYIAAHSEES